MASINFNNALGIHPKAFQLRASRAEILANNIANADTPGFKARDINFQAVLNAEQENANALPIERTHRGHLVGKQMIDSDLKYRNPTQPSIDGNTVDSQYEQAVFTRNAMNFNSSFEFLNNRLTGLAGAIRGE